MSTKAKARPAITLAEFFRTQGRGSKADAARALEISKGYLTDLTNPDPARRKHCHPTFAKRLAEYVAKHGYALRTGPLVGLEEP